MKFGSVCSGIEAASVAWEPLGMKAAWFAEIDEFPSAVLKHHWPETKNWGDMTLIPELIRAGKAEAPDVFVGGTPCQAFSLAGYRKGLDDKRGQLSLTFCEIADAIDEKRAELGQKPSVVVWENVVGALSSDDNAFGCFLSALCGEEQPLVPPKNADGGWPSSGIVIGKQRKIAYRVLSSENFGLPQTRRRVFVMASARDDFDPANVMFDHYHESVIDHITSLNGKSKVGVMVKQGETKVFSFHQPSQYKRDGDINNSLSFLFGEEPPLIFNSSEEPSGDAFKKADISSILEKNSIDYMFYLSEDKKEQIHRLYLSKGIEVPEAVEKALKSEDVQPIERWIVPESSINRNRVGHAGNPKLEICPTLMARSFPHCVTEGSELRKFTPIEYERIQGFPDDHTKIDWDNGTTFQGCSIAKRYKAIGNSKSVPVVNWIGRRMIDEMSKK